MFCMAQFEAAHGFADSVMIGIGKIGTNGENIVQKDFIDNPEKALNKDTNKTENENYTL